MLSLFLLLLASVGAAKARPARSDLGLGIGASGGFGVGLGLGLGGTGSAASGSGQGAGYSAWSGPSGGSAHKPRLATGRARALGLVPARLGTRAQRLAVVRARRRASARGWDPGLRAA